MKSSTSLKIIIDVVEDNLDIELAGARIGREAGFTDYVAKFEREALIASLRANLATAVHA
jgi:hypothetical protein